MPTEDEQFKAYKEVLEKAEGKRVIVRTLDIGGDKDLKYLNLGKEDNPFLGYRAIRICLREPEIFKIQLRALYRAGIYGKLAICGQILYIDIRYCPRFAYCGAYCGAYCEV